MRAFFLFFILLFPSFASPQELPSFETEQELEQLTESAEDAEETDDSWLQQLEYRKKNRLNLNSATAADFIELQLLSDLEISAFLSYRKNLGLLVSIYELQAVPGWDISLIRKMLPYITVSTPLITKENLKKRFSEGNQQLIFRYSSIVEKGKGYREKNADRSFYTGDPSRFMLRYKYQYKNLLQYGATIAKDAGERLWNNKKGTFDFNSFHIFMGKTGIVKSFALGDYTINLGQGLIHWQGMAFGKGAGVWNIKRQSPVLRPYNSSGYYFFHRGAALTLEKKHWETTLFLSGRRLDARVEGDNSDTETFITSISASGYHRTQQELSNQGNLQALTYGGNLRYKNKQGYAGLNLLQYHFSYSLKKEDSPYNLYALSGRNYRNLSVDYGYTFKNIHFFGEVAIDKSFRHALLNGILFSIHPKAALSLLHRSISKSYQAFFGNAFTVNSIVSNEQGLFMGFSLKPAPSFGIDLYLDLFRFPWLKYRIDAPSYGKDYHFQFTYKPSKRTELYTRYKVRQKSLNQKLETNAMNEVVATINSSWRTQIVHRVNPVFLFRQRFELLWYTIPKSDMEKGFLAFFDVFCNPERSRLNANFRLQIFQCDSYNSRLYAYENDVLCYYAVPVFYDNGLRYYVNARYKLNKSFSLWLKWAQTIYSNKTAIGSGLDEINGNKKSEIRMLLSASF